LKSEKPTMESTNRMISLELIQGGTDTAPNPQNDNLTAATIYNTITFDPKLSLCNRISASGPKIKKNYYFF
jgi:hypothetical protein